ncbi:TPA: hypothetical protein CPT90_07470 [Candidatus Gastranaerophilales bacterium HUM_3]|nr:MAG TPA: hypothetical protein CPT90_07470 [Candidatus Gastranaerophilales bacterium HUM_3]DAA86451.1 MAG TPA: hypothetical protein CPT99_06375 [Candidatus Gastranaerophilales bacterium HUM_4]DAA92765.1 MAG TPA: hypothetical protein CPT87_00215 [Candidatus Gastranaerophilales bacterium HUM_5]DAA94879.1 MAG TPA: hypothetical protein CPT88_07425 [Candidatus Gastranaerophilales bacterium HUM_8]DAA99414.1 MAG TPA: hypothetical protein CPT96_08700 [Candidatus Gastranaerophilales bacterium HUM_10]
MENLKYFRRLNTMLEYYTNQKAGIFFDDNPHVCIRYYIPSMTEEERKSIEKYPFINKKNLQVRLCDYQKDKTYNFGIPKGYCYDGASIPRLFWRVIGSNTDNRFLIPALVHDVLCENHNYVDNDRNFSTEVFNALLEASEVNAFKRFCMKKSVNCYQRFCKW